MSILASTRCTAVNAKGLQAAHWRATRLWPSVFRPRTCEAQERLARKCFDLATKMADTAETIGWEGRSVCPHLSIEVCNYLDRFDKEIYPMINHRFPNLGNEDFTENYMNGLAALSDRLADYT